MILKIKLDKYIILMFKNIFSLFSINEFMGIKNRMFILPTKTISSCLRRDITM